MLPEKRETEFAFIFGQVMGFLAADDIKKYLKDLGIEEFEIDHVLGRMKLIAKKAFYNHD